MTVCRFTIKVYSDNTFSTEKGEYITMINPSNINITNDIDYNNSQLGYNTNWQLRYKSYLPRILSFSLLFDSTGILTRSNVDIKKQIEDLEGLIYSYKKDIKEPYYVRVIWGTIDFKGRLLKMQTNYSLFKSEGSPIRAKVNISIIEQQNKILDGNSQKKVDDGKDNKNVADSGARGGSSGGETSKKIAENKAQSDINDTGSGGGNRDDAIQEKETSKKQNTDVSDDEDGDKNNKASTDDSGKKNENSDESTNGKNDEDSVGSNEAGSKNQNNREEETNNEVQQVIAKESDSLPSITKKCLENSGVKISSAALNSILCQAARFNLLDTLKSLAAGAVFALPLTLLGLLKSLMNKLLSLLKRGVTFIKKKTKSGAQAVAGAAKNFAGKVKTGYNNVKGKVT